MIFYISRKTFNDLKAGRVSFSDLESKGKIYVVAKTSMIETTEAYFYQKKNISQKTRWQVFERDGFKCKKCRGGGELHCDHIKPESKGGKTELLNLQTLCAKCNLKKGSKA